MGCASPVKNSKLRAINHFKMAQKTTGNAGWARAMRAVYKEKGVTQNSRYLGHYKSEW